MSDLLSTGASALLSFQRAMTTTSHNVANANTPGYSRQRVELNSRGANYAGYGFIGAGVEVTTIRRMVNVFLTGRLDQSAAEMGRLTALSGLSSRVNRMMTESSTSISGPLSGYFDSVEGVSADPRSSAAREGMLQSAQNLAARFQTQQRQLNELETETNQQISAEVGEINQLTTPIARLNDEIVRLKASGQPPNDLMDQRDPAIQTLSGKIGVTTTDQGDGALNVFTTGGLNLVLGKTTQTITAASDPLRPERLQLSLSSPSGPISLGESAVSGTLSGLFAVRREVIDPAALDRSAQPQWTHEDCVNYESARELITELMAFRSEWIVCERAKTVPDLSAIERWKIERGAYAAELRGLDVTDRENIARIRRDYGAEVRRLAAGA